MSLASHKTVVRRGLEGSPFASPPQNHDTNAYRDLPLIINGVRVMFDTTPCTIPAGPHRAIIKTHGKQLTDRESAFLCVEETLGPATYVMKLNTINPTTFGPELVFAVAPYTSELRIGCWNTSEEMPATLCLDIVLHAKANAAEVMDDVCAILNATPEGATATVHNHQTKIRVKDAPSHVIRALGRLEDVRCIEAVLPPTHCCARRRLVV